jgi:hypothetical protein
MTKDRPRNGGLGNTDPIIFSLDRAGKNNISKFDSSAEKWHYVD